jgi:hypothetical protein
MKAAQFRFRRHHCHNPLGPGTGGGGTQLQTHPPRVQLSPSSSVELQKGSAGAGKTRPIVVSPAPPLPCPGPEADEGCPISVSPAPLPQPLGPGTGGGGTQLQTHPPRVQLSPSSSVELQKGLGRSGQNPPNRGFAGTTATNPTLSRNGRRRNTTVAQPSGVQPSRSWSVELRKGSAGVAAVPPRWRYHASILSPPTICHAPISPTEWWPLGFAAPRPRSTGSTVATPNSPAPPLSAFLPPCAAGSRRRSSPPRNPIGIVDGIGAWA